MARGDFVSELLYPCYYPSACSSIINFLKMQVKLGTHYPCPRAVFTGTSTAREHGPWTRVVCTELEYCSSAAGSCSRLSTIL